MIELTISEANTVQMPMVRHASAIGWVPVPPQEALAHRGGQAGLLFRGELEIALRRFNPWLNDDAIRGVIERLESLPPTIEGNRQMLAWLRGERQWYDEIDQRHRAVMLIDFDTPGANVLQVTWEWTLKPPARKGNRADVMFLINGVPVAIVENKNPKDTDAIDRGIGQLLRYERETPELLSVRRNSSMSPTCWTTGTALHGTLRAATWHVGRNARRKPIGSPSSPSLSRRTSCVLCGTGFSFTSRTGRLK